MQKKNKILTAAALCLCLLGLAAWYIKANYQIFFHPFQIISNEDVAKNKQGICAAENRKLSNDELLNRAMASYFEYEQQIEYKDVGDGKTIRKPCTTGDCYIAILPPLTREQLYQQYILGEPETSQPKLYNIIQDKQNHIKLTQTAALFKNIKNNSFSIFLHNNGVTDYFFPQDCCRIVRMEEIEEQFNRNREYNLSQLPTFYKERGVANYFLKIDSIDPINVGYFRSGSFFANNPTPSDAFVSYKLDAIDNCGNFSPRKFSTKFDDPLLHTMHIAAGYNSFKILPMKEAQISECYPIKNSPLSDFIFHNQDKFSNLREFKIHWGGNQFFICPASK